MTRPAIRSRLVDRTEGLVAIAHQLTVADHGPESAFERDQILFIGERECGGDFVDGERRAMTGQGFEDELPARNGVGVLPRLALAMGVRALGRCG
jgi:hypothetical protein